MSLTRANVESELVRRVGAWLTAAGLDGTTVDGTNTALASPIAWALRQSGYSVALATAPADGDLDDVVDADVDKVFDLAELRTLENAYRNYTKVDVVAGAVGAKKDQLRQGMQRAISEIRAKLQDDYGIGGATAFSVQLTRSDGYTAVEDAL